MSPEPHHRNNEPDNSDSPQPDYFDAPKEYFREYPIGRRILKEAYEPYSIRLEFESPEFLKEYLSEAGFNLHLEIWNHLFEAVRNNTLINPKHLAALGYGCDRFEITQSEETVIQSSGNSARSLSVTLRPYDFDIEETHNYDFLPTTPLASPALEGLEILITRPTSKSKAHLEFPRQQALVITIAWEDFQSRPTNELLQDRWSFLDTLVQRLDRPKFSPNLTEWVAATWSEEGSAKAPGVPIDFYGTKIRVGERPSPSETSTEEEEPQREGRPTQGSPLELENPSAQNLSKVLILTGLPLSTNACKSILEFARSGSILPESTIAELRSLGLEKSFITDKIDAIENGTNECFHSFRLADLNGAHKYVELCVFLYKEDSDSGVAVELSWGAGRDDFTRRQWNEILKAAGLY